MASKNPSVPVNEPGDRAFRDTPPSLPKSELAQIKASEGIEARGQEGSLGDSGVWVPPLAHDHWRTFLGPRGNRKYFTYTELVAFLKYDWDITDLRSCI